MTTTITNFKKRLKQLNKLPFTDEVIREVQYIEMQLEALIP